MYLGGNSEYIETEVQCKNFMSADSAYNGLRPKAVKLIFYVLFLISLRILQRKEN